MEADEAQQRGMSEFAEKVYAHVRTIQAGEVHTYGSVAAAIGNPKAARAVGTALKNNPYGPDSGCDPAFVVNCHRVVPASREVGSYFGQSDSQKKRRLLETEGVRVDANGKVCSECVRS